MPNGACVSLAEYSYFFNRQQELGIHYKYYPSSNHTYCSADDSTCSACASTWSFDYSKSGSIDTSANCSGRDGCLCLARCELPDWSSSVLSGQCSSTSETNNQTSTASRIGFALAVGIAFGVLLGLWGIKLLFRRGVGRGSVPAVRETWTVPRRSRTGPQLALTGWKELREQLIAIEKEVYRDNVTSHGRSEDIQTPDMEEGASYHPASPTQQRPRDAARLL
ncbi:hypothetical protein DVH05_019828 [Phytophthora capsici]|nr:hypothetical protein DVH05_019828 [Phytophthora capsici]